MIEASDEKHIERSRNRFSIVMRMFSIQKMKNNAGEKGSMVFLAAADFSR